MRIDHKRSLILVLHTSKSRYQRCCTIILRAILSYFTFFFFNDPPPPEFSPLPLHAPFPIWPRGPPAERAMTSNNESESGPAQIERDPFSPTQHPSRRPFETTQNLLTTPTRMRYICPMGCRGC